MSVKYSFRCPDELDGRLSERIELTGETVSAVVVEALKRFLDPVYQRELYRQMAMEMLED